MSNAIEKRLGARIAGLRRAARLTQEELAEVVGLAAVTISRLERGVTVPSLATLGRIGKALHTELPELFEGDWPRSAKTQAIEKLAIQLRQRTANEVALVNELAQTVFRLNDSKPRQ